MNPVGESVTCVACMKTFASSDFMTGHQCGIHKGECEPLKEHDLNCEPSTAGGELVLPTPSKGEDGDFNNSVKSAPEDEVHTQKKDEDSAAKCHDTEIEGMPSIIIKGGGKIACSICRKEYSACQI